MAFEIEIETAITHMESGVKIVIFRHETTIFRHKYRQKNFLSTKKSQVLNKL